MREAELSFNTGTQSLKPQSLLDHSVVLRGEIGKTDALSNAHFSLSSERVPEFASNWTVTAGAFGDPCHSETNSLPWKTFIQAPKRQGRPIRIHRTKIH